MPLALQHHMDALIANRRRSDATAFMASRGSRSAPVWSDTGHWAIDLKCFTRALLAHSMRRTCMGHSIPLRVGRHQHLAATSLAAS